MKRMEDDLTPTMWAVLLVTAAAGTTSCVVAALQWDLRLAVGLAALWALGVLAFVIMTYRKARREGAGFWRSAGRTLRRFFGVVLDTTF